MTFPLVETAVVSYAVFGYIIYSLSLYLRHRAGLKENPYDYNPLILITVILLWPYILYTIITNLVPKSRTKGKSHGSN